MEDLLFDDETSKDQEFQSLKRLRRKPRLSFESVINKKTLDKQELDEVFLSDCM